MIKQLNDLNDTSLEQTHGKEIKRVGNKRLAIAKLLKTIVKLEIEGWQDLYIESFDAVYTLFREFTHNSFVAGHFEDMFKQLFVITQSTNTIGFTGLFTLRR